MNFDENMLVFFKEQHFFWVKILNVCYVTCCISCQTYFNVKNRITYLKLITGYIYLKKSYRVDNNFQVVVCALVLKQKLVQFPDVNCHCCDYRGRSRTTRGTHTVPWFEVNESASPCVKTSHYSSCPPPTGGGNDCVLACRKISSYPVMEKHLFMGLWWLLALLAGC